ncbi:hypothetical protein M0R45_026741 [Rubus argutus]|uniref:Uncharacterized protein n=1 Tax=Rubus argutus TaxID=59490 RepID=A0AAW1WYV3_RUBAR
MSSVIKEGKKKSRTTILDRPTTVTWLERKSLADKETETLEKQIQDLKTWANMVESMNEEQLKEYLENRPDEFKTVKIHNIAPRQRIQRIEKPKCSTSNGIMASVWKFHKEEEQQQNNQSL